MTDHELEQRLRTFYGVEIGERPAPGRLYESLVALPATAGASSWPRIRFGLLAAATLLALAAVGAWAVGQVREAPVGGSGMIAFTAQDGSGSFMTYLVNPDGSGKRELSTSPVFGRMSWSPDGSRVTFAGTGGLRVMNADGSGLTAFALPRGEYADPAWSPDGNRIVFSHQEPTGDWDLYAMDPDGSNLAQLTSGEGSDLGASWSPDGTEIVFGRETGRNSNLFVVSVGDLVVRQLTDDPGINLDPAWSPDGRTIAYSHRPIPADGGNVSSFHPPWDIWLVGSDGTAARQFTDDPGSELSPAWSPDGRMMVFGAHGHDWSIYVMNADGSDQHGIVTEADVFPSWMPPRR